MNVNSTSTSTQPLQPSGWRIDPKCTVIMSDDVILMLRGLAAASSSSIYVVQEQGARADGFHSPGRRHAC